MHFVLTTAPAGVGSLPDKRKSGYYIFIYKSISMIVLLLQVQHYNRCEREGFSTTPADPVRER